MILFGSLFLSNSSIFQKDLTCFNNTKSSNNCQIQIRLSNDPTQCGGNQGSPTGSTVTTSISFGCKTQGSPIADLLFAIIRFLSNGVGILVVLSIVIAGIQYIGSRGEPQGTAQAIARIRSSLIALVIYIFAYAILNYLIPVGFFKV